MIDASQDTLRELGFLGSHIDKVPVRILDSLTHLEIWDPEGDFNALPFVFRHARGLESLVGGCRDPRFFPWTLT
jgi:hypothetical protein